MKKYSQPQCTAVSIATAISIQAASLNGVSKSGQEVTTDGESGNGGASEAYAKWWSSSGNNEEDAEFE
jgi:hypothetical protein